MQPTTFWQLFEETGDPVYYLLYREWSDTQQAPIEKTA